MKNNFLDLPRLERAEMGVTVSNLATPSVVTGTTVESDFSLAGMTGLGRGAGEGVAAHFLIPTGLCVSFWNNSSHDHFKVSLFKFSSSFLLFCTTYTIWLLFLPVICLP